MTAQMAQMICIHHDVPQCRRQEVGCPMSEGGGAPGALRALWGTGDCGVVGGLGSNQSWPSHAISVGPRSIHLSTLVGAFVRYMYIIYLCYRISDHPSPSSAAWWMPPRRPHPHHSSLRSCLLCLVGRCLRSCRRRRRHMVALLLGRPTVALGMVSLRLPVRCGKWGEVTGRGSCASGDLLCSGVLSAHHVSAASHLTRLPLISQCAVPVQLWPLEPV